MDSIFRKIWGNLEETIKNCFSKRVFNTFEIEMKNQLIFIEEETEQIKQFLTAALFMISILMWKKNERNHSETNAVY